MLSVGTDCIECWHGVSVSMDSVVSGTVLSVGADYVEC
jgi:hypothetical protein